MSNSEFSPGVLVWAKLQGHPWWPGLVCKGPEENSHQMSNKQGKFIHVQFFDKKSSHAWIRISNVKPYEGKKGPECSPGGKYHSNQKAWSTSLAKAEKAEFMTTKERLKLVVHQAEKKSHNSDDSDSLSESSKEKLTKIKKRKKPQQDAQRPSKKRKVDHSDAEKSFVLGKDKVPEHWETPFVLMSTRDVPENLQPGQVVSVKDTANKTAIKLEVPDEEEVETNDIDSEDEQVDSDADPGWTPEMEDSNAEEPEEHSEPDDVQEEEEKEEEEESGYDDSDEDPGWAPEKKKKKLNNAKRSMKFGLMSRPGPASSKHKKGPKAKIEPKSSLTNSEPAAANKPSQVKKTLPPQSLSPSVSVPSGGIGRPARNIVITDNTPTGPEPDVGDFVLEKAECKDGNIPFLWRYKRGGLIQKYERKEEDGKVFYQNVLSFSDWWACFAHKYQKVKTQVQFKYRTVERVTLAEEPVIEPEVPTPIPAQEQTSTSSITSSSNRQATSSSSSSQRMQEEEISSTTQEPSTELPEPSFQIGNYVLDMKDKRNVDNFPIWKIESQILLKKYEPFIKNGNLLHKPVKTYRGYREISKHYIPVQVKRVHDFSGDEYVEVTEASRPKLSVSQRTEEEYEKSPLLRHFYVYLQVFLSQALEPGFLDEVRKTKDPTYMFPLGEVDKIVEQKKTNLERKVKWTNRLKDALKKCPYLREVNKPDDKKKCEAVVDSEESVEESVFLFGSDYDADTLKQSGNSHSCQEFKIGQTAIQYITTYHQLCHFRYNLYDKCLAKIKLIRDSHDGVEVEKIMDECLGNKAWVLQNFEDFMTLVEIS